MIRYLATASALAAILLASACSSTPTKPFFPTTGELVELNIMTSPVGLDLDGQPGIDGFSVKVYANNASNPKPVPIRTGVLEVLMWDGSLYGRTNLPAPLHVWSYTAQDLRNFEFTGGIGTGYQLALNWGRDIPTRHLVSVGARYTSPEGKIITSGLSSVTVLNK